MEDEFDYIIVGAGSAGCVLASRLSERSDVRVALIDAGPRDRNPLIHIPLGVAALVRHPRLNWCFQTTPQEYAGGRSIPMPAGRVLGGSSSINGMVYMRGHPLDYDAWSEAGNAGWSYEEVLPYFVRSENNETWRSSPFHGIGGPLNVTNLRSTNAVSDVFVDAALSLQYPPCDDFAGPQPEGFGLRQVTQRNGCRQSAATAFLTPISRRPNLKILTGRTVQSVRFEGLRAIGVEVVSEGERRILRSRREVIVSAGAIGSPTLLMRSGIGDGAHLQAVGIETLYHAAEVGRNLQDHAAVSLQYRTSHTGPYGISLRVLPRLAWNGLEYLLFRRGLIASNALEAAGFVKTNQELDRPDIQFSFVAGSRSRNGRIGFGHGYGAAVILLRPKSRGSVRLSERPSDPPVIDPRFFEQKEDVDTLVHGLKLGRKIFQTSAFEPYRAQEQQPGLNVSKDEDLRAYIAATSNTAFHPVGTCRMGSDIHAVVDAELRVRGVQALRVVDASVMPTIVSGNTNAPTIMIAEKAADMILGRRPLPPVPTRNV